LKGAGRHTSQDFSWEKGELQILIDAGSKEVLEEISGENIGSNTSIFLCPKQEELLGRDQVDSAKTLQIC